MQEIPSPCSSTKWDHSTIPGHLLHIETRETYQYYDLPFCRSEPIKWKKETLGEVLNGDRLASALYELKFLEAKTGVTLCSKKLKVDEVAKFRKAVADDFYFQMYYDDLPIWGYIGKIEDGSLVLSEKGNKYYLFTRVQFDALYNGDQVVEIRAFSDPTSVVDITDDIEINVKFTYSIVWSETSAQFKTRMDKYSRASSLPTLHKIHWFSFINSIVFILLLMGLLILLILRRLKNDLRKCSSGDEEEDKEVGWKYIHGDVFRYPQNISLFSAVMGVGNQLLTIVCILFVLAFLGILYPYNRGLLSTSLVLLYSLTSVVAGYITSSFHNQFSDAGWERSVFLAGILYFGPLTVTVLILNTVAVSYGATAALPFGTIMVIVFIYMLFAVPLLALGGRIGYWFRSEFQAPSALNRYPREIPPLPWYQKSPCQMFIVGLLSFSTIALELHHLYASLWGYKIFTPPGILFVMFIILLVLTAILSIGLTYIQLSVEDHEWWWRSVFRGGSTAIFMFAYSIYFYFRSNMSGFLQLSFFLGYNAAMCYAFFLILGSISFRASMIFVRRIYRVVKSE
ncbi:transmembrane 9 superfamily member 5 isoform X2 [Citrus clementina]|uniref:transmembrane 9 superfamily member 5 isoform X2 n=1 Tax=Citrus clementina TaxID=85681 RepID=UPI000CED5164|nr:transmembrane 9 superfamily member 5 isoform X2 [Citrus x clementina]